MAVHRQQATADCARMAQHTEKQRSRLRDITQRLIQMAARMAQMAQGGGVDPGDRTVAYHGVEHPQDRFRFADEQIVLTQIDQRAAQLKIVINRTRLFVGGQREDRFVKQLQQHLVEFRDAAGDAEIILHHLLNRLVAFAAVIQALSDAQLAIEQQAVIVTTDH